MAAFARIRWLAIGLLLAQALSAHSLVTALAGTIIAGSKDA